MILIRSFGTSIHTYSIECFANQVPGSTTYGLALYFMTKTPLEETPILERFVNGDDAYRNSRFKLIPYISKVSVLSLLFEIKQSP